MRGGGFTDAGKNLGKKGAPNLLEDLPKVNTDRRAEKKA